jgi:hypothetical protein
MKAFLQNILRKEGPPGAPDALPDGAGGGGSAGTSPEILGQARETAASDPAALVLEVNDFLARIPPHLLKTGEFDSHRPLRFDVGEVAGRLNRGISTIPLGVLLEAAPEIFSDEALAQADLEIRFPWQRVLALINESAAAAKDGEKTLAQRLRAGLEADRKPTGEKVQKTGGDSLRQGPAQPGIGAATGRDAASFNRSKGSDPGQSTVGTAAPRAAGGDGSGTVVSQKVTPREALLPAAPDSAPPLVELPDPAAETGAAPAPIVPADRARVAASQRIPDLMDLSTAPPSASEGGEASALPRTDKPGFLATSATPGAADTQNMARIAALEAQLKELSARHQSEISALRTESSRAAEKVRSETARQGSELVARLALEQKEISAEKEAQMATQDVEQKALLASQQNELRSLVAERDSALAAKEEELSRLREEHRQKLNTLLLDLDVAVRDRDVIALRLEEAGPLAKLAEASKAELEAALAARDSEIAALKEASARAAAIRDEAAAHAAAQAAELEMQGRVTAQLEADIAQYRARIKAVLLERDALAGAAKLKGAEPANPPVSTKPEISSGAAGASGIATAA